MDMICRLRDQKLMAAGLATSKQWPEVIEAVRKKRGSPFKVSGGRDKGLIGSSDHSVFYQMGMPVIFFFTGFDVFQPCVFNTVLAADRDGDGIVLDDEIGVLLFQFGHEFFDEDRGRLVVLDAQRSRLQIYNKMDGYMVPQMNL